MTTDRVSFGFLITDLRFLHITLDQFDPFRHQFPLALEPITQGQIVALTIGKETFTAEPSFNPAYADGLAHRSAETGQHIPVTIKPGLFMVLIKEIE